MYDLSVDTLINALLFVCIGIGARHGILGEWALPLGILAGISVAFIFWLVTRIEAVENNPFPSAAGFDPDDTLYLVGPIAWLGGLTPFLMTAALGAPIFAIWTSWQHRHVWL